LFIAHLSIQLGLGRREVMEGSFSCNIYIAGFHTTNLLVMSSLTVFFVKDVRIELFPPPLKLPGCDVMLWIDDYMTPKDIEWVVWVKKNKAAMSKGVSSSK
jgi:hypothetical protein